MRALVIKRFRDKESKKVFCPGDNIEVSEERFSELVAAGDYVEKVQDEASEADEEAENVALESEKVEDEAPEADEEAPKTKDTTKRKAGRKPSAKN